MAEALPRIDITEMYGRLNDGLIQLVEYIPEEKLEWSPRENLWDFRHILAHPSVLAAQLDGEFPDPTDQARGYLRQDGYEGGDRRCAALRVGRGELGAGASLCPA